MPGKRKSRTHTVVPEQSGYVTDDVASKMMSDLCSTARQSKVFPYAKQTSVQELYRKDDSERDKSFHDIWSGYATLLDILNKKKVVQNLLHARAGVSALLNYIQATVIVTQKYTSTLTSEETQYLLAMTIIDDYGLPSDVLSAYVCIRGLCCSLMVTSKSGYLSSVLVYPWRSLKLLRLGNIISIQKKSITMMVQSLATCKENRKYGCEWLSLFMSSIKTHQSTETTIDQREISFGICLSILMQEHELDVLYKLSCQHSIEVMSSCLIWLVDFLDKNNGKNGTNRSKIIKIISTLGSASHQFSQLRDDQRALFFIINILCEYSLDSDVSVCSAALNGMSEIVSNGICNSSVCLLMISSTTKCLFSSIRIRSASIRSVVQLLQFSSIDPSDDATATVLDTLSDSLHLLCEYYSGQSRITELDGSVIRNIDLITLNVQRLLVLEGSITDMLKEVLQTRLSSNSNFLQGLVSAVSDPEMLSNLGIELDSEVVRSVKSGSVGFNWFLLKSKMATPTLSESELVLQLREMFSQKMMSDEFDISLYRNAISMATHYQLTELIYYPSLRDSALYFCPDTVLEYLASVCSIDIRVVMYPLLLQLINERDWLLTFRLYTSTLKWASKKWKETASQRWDSEEKKLEAGQQQHQQDDDPDQYLKDELIARGKSDFISRFCKMCYQEGPLGLFQSVLANSILTIEGNEACKESIQYVTDNCFKEITSNYREKLTSGNTDRILIQMCEVVGKCGDIGAEIIIKLLLNMSDEQIISMEGDKDESLSLQSVALQQAGCWLSARNLTKTDDLLRVVALNYKCGAAVRIIRKYLSVDPSPGQAMLSLFMSLPSRERRSAILAVIAGGLPKSVASSCTVPFANVVSKILKRNLPDQSLAADAAEICAVLPGTEHAYSLLISAFETVCKSLPEDEPDPVLPIETSLLSALNKVATNNNSAATPAVGTKTKKRSSKSQHLEDLLRPFINGNSNPEKKKRTTATTLPEFHDLSEYEKAAEGLAKIRAAAEAEIPTFDF